MSTSLFEEQILNSGHNNNNCYGAGVDKQVIKIFASWDFVCGLWTK